MPSDLLVPIAEINKLEPHPNADRLELATILGWQLVVGKGLYKEGQRLIYVPPDSVMPQELSDALDITKFLSKGRVRQVKLRGEPSFGATVPLELAEMYGVDPNLPLGTNVAETLNITKYEPPVRATAGDATSEHPLFPKYTSIVNIRNYPDVITMDDEVVLTEKIHGTNCRAGLVEGEWMAGSHGLQRKNPAHNLDSLATEEEVYKAWAKNTYWYPLSLEPVRQLLRAMTEKGYKQVVLYGEIYGNIQKKYHYGFPNGVSFRAFDLLVDGKFVNYPEFTTVCDKYGVPQVPHIAVGHIDYNGIVDMVEKFETSRLSKEHSMEGVVVKPIVEKHDPRIGRVILKYITNAYLFDKGGSDYKDE